jgi:hypothetical protein
MYCMYSSIAPHYNEDRPHHGVGNRPLRAPEVEVRPALNVDCRERLGGLLRSYRGMAA